MVEEHRNPVWGPAISRYQELKHWVKARKLRQTTHQRHQDNFADCHPYCSTEGREERKKA